MQFEDIVRRYYAPLLSYVRSIGGDEDHVQEAFIAAYRAYNGYTEQGKTMAWLKTIARRIVYREKANIPILFSYDAPEFNEMPFTNGESLYEDLACADGCAQILAAIEQLPERQRNVVYYRIFGGFSVAETAKMLNLPAGTVKSNSHYGMASLKQKLKPYLIEGEHIMDCKKTMEYLWQYARDAILPMDKEKVAQHLEVCTECGDIANSLRQLAGYMKVVPEGTTRYYNISFKLSTNDVLVYMGTKVHMPNYKEMTEFLAENKGDIPNYKEDYRMNFNNYVKHIAEFDNEGNRMEVETFDGEPGYTALVYPKLYKVFEYHEMNSVATVSSEIGVIYSTSSETPNHYKVSTSNQFGPAARSGLFVAIPGNATNVRMIQGNDVVDCGAYKFVYVDAYVVEGQINAVEATYEL